MREKLTREINYIEKTFTEYSRNKQGDYYTFLEIIYVFAKHNGRWLQGCTALADKVCKELTECINNRQRAAIEDMGCKERIVKEFCLNEKDEIYLLAKVLLEYIKRNP